MTYIIGVDPGQRGGMCLIKNDGVIEYTTMPETVRGILNWLEVMRTRSIIDGNSLKMIIEKAQPMPKQGVVSSFNYGRHFGIFEAIAASLKIPYYEISPVRWKKAIGLNSDKLNSIRLCQRLYPKVNLIPEGCRKAHDGIAEAILIATYGLRMGL